MGILDKYLITQTPQDAHQAKARHVTVTRRLFVCSTLAQYLKLSTEGAHCPSPPPHPGETKNSMQLPAPGPGSSLAATIANAARTLFYVDFPDSMFMFWPIFNSSQPCLSTPAVAAPWFLWPAYVPDFIGSLITLAMLKELVF